MKALLQAALNGRVPVPSRKAIYCQLLALAASAATAAQPPAMDPPAWPCFHGPRPERPLTVEGCAWLTDLATIRHLWTQQVGIGYSAVAVVEGSAVTLGHDAQKKQTSAWCFNPESGKLRWRVTWPCDMKKMNKWGSTTTPTIDREKVYILDKNGLFLCLDLANGHENWRTDLAKEPWVTVPIWGFASSPLVCGETLLINAGSAGAALRASDGTVAWHSAPGAGSYASVLPVADGTALVFADKGLVSVCAADGAEQWSIPFNSHRGIRTMIPLVTATGILISQGYGMGSGLVRREPASGRFNLAWTGKDLQTQMTGPVLVGDHVYGVSAHGGKPGELICLDPANGKPTWRQPGFGQGTVIGISARLLVLDDKGTLVLVNATPTAYQEISRREVIRGTCCTTPMGDVFLGESPLQGRQVLRGTCWTHPVVAQGRLFVRNAKGEVACWDMTAETR